MKKIYFVFVFLMMVGVIFAQQVLVTEEPAITELMKRYLEENKREKTIKGWRIQIIATTDRRKMQNAKTKFISIYPDIKLKWEHIPPYYKVAIGAWEDKITCEAFLVDIKNHFHTSIPVVDDIKKVELIN